MAVHTLEKHMSAVVMNVNDSVTQVNKTLVKVNGKGGTLQQIDQSLTDVRTLVSHSDRTLTAQQKSIAAFDTNLATLVQNLTNDADAVGHETVLTMGTARTTMESANQALTELSADEVSANTAIAHFTEQMDSLQPVVLSTLNNTDTTMANVAASTTDVKNFIHKETTPKHLGFWGSMEAGAVWAHKILMQSIF
jgi:uncharacterized phage infection (PIP) family protein YhgE